MFFDTDRFEMITIYSVVYCIPDLRRLNGTLKTPFIAPADWHQPILLKYLLVDFRRGNANLETRQSIYILYGIDPDAKKKPLHNKAKILSNGQYAFKLFSSLGSICTHTLQTRPQTKMKNEYLAGEYVCVRFRIICSSTPRLCAARQ